MGSTRGRESVSFVIIAFNEEANIARAIFAITGLEGLGDHEIIVVNDGSRDGTARVVRDIARRDPAVRLIDTGDNRGRGYARSTGVAAARGALIATVDADVILPPDWLTRARQALCGRDAVGGIAVPDGDVTYLRKRFGLAPRVVHGTTTVTGNNGLYRRGVFDVIGFDPALREGEDSALNHAMRRHGLSAATVPGLLVQHEGNKTLLASLRWLFEVGQGATRQLLTYGEIRQPDIVTGAFVGATALGLATAARKHRLAGRGHTGRLRPGREHPARTQPVRDAARPAAAGGARGRRRQRDAHRLLRRAAGGPEHAAPPGAYPGGGTPPGARRPGPADGGGVAPE